MALTVALSGATTIQQGQSTTLTATVTDSHGNAVDGATVAFSAPRGSFSAASVNTDSNGQASTDWTAGFTDPSDVDVVITAAASTPANPNPTVSGPSLTALAELGITGIVANLYITSTGDITNSQREIYRMGSVGTAHANSDPDITSDLAINRVRWSINDSRLTLNRAGTEAWSVWDDTNQNASIFIITNNGTYIDIPVDEADLAGSGFIRWDIDSSQHSAFVQQMDFIDAGDQLVIGVGDSDSIGFAADSGSGTATVTAEAQMATPVATTLEIVSGDNQSAEVGTALANPLVVRVLDQNGDAFSGATVTFSTTGGVLSTTSETTGANGQASTELTLSNTPGMYTVTASVLGLTDVMFGAIANAVAPPAAQSTEPQSLTVTFPSATTALLEWSQPTNFGEPVLEEWQVNANSGGYVDTGSTSLRFLVRRLDRGASQSFSVRGKRTDGTFGDAATVTGTTPIATIHNTLFFVDCRNLEGQGSRVTEHGNASNVLRTAADNDLDTYTDETDISIDISEDSDPTRVDAVMVISSGVSTYTGTPSGGSGTGWTARTIPSTVENWEGNDVSTTVDGRQHDLFFLDSHFTATDVRIQFTGTNVRVYEVYLLEFGRELDANGQFTEIAPELVDRTYVLHESETTGTIERETDFGGRDRWETNLVARFVPGITEIENPADFLRWRERNKNHFFIEEFTRHPDRGYPASFMRQRVPVQLRGNDKNLGDTIQLTIGER